MKIANVSKKMLALLMAMLMMFSCMAVVANAAAATITLTEADYELNADKDAITVNKIMYNGKTADVVLTPENDVEEVLHLNDGRTRFDGIKTGKTYTIMATVTEGDAIIAIGTLSVSIKKSQNAPANPVPTEITSTSIVISAVSGCEYQLSVIENDSTTVKFPWSDSKGSAAIKYNELDPDTKYLVEARKKATDTYYESPVASIVVITKESGTLEVPDLFLEDKTNKSITLGTKDKNVEFSRDGKTWQDSNEFTGLTANTQYTFYARFKYDEANEDPSLVSNAIVVKTNERANTLAQRKNITFTAKDGQYANEGIEFTVKGDGPANMNNVIYGDTRIVPIAYNVTFGQTPVTSASWDTVKLSQTGKFTAEDFAEKTVKIAVIFKTQEYKGKLEDGSANWSDGEAFTEEYEVKIGKVNNIWTQIGSFFETVANFLLDTVPAFIADAMQSDIWGRLFAVLGNLGKALG